MGKIRAQILWWVTEWAPLRNCSVRNYKKTKNFLLLIRDTSPVSPVYVNLSTKYQESIKVWLETGSLAKRTNDNLTVYLSSLHTTIGRYTPDFDWKWQPPPPRDWLLIITFRNVKTEYLHEWRINERSIKSIVFPVVSPLKLLLNLVLKGDLLRLSLSLSLSWWVFAKLGWLSV